MNDNAFKTALFWVLLLIFSATAALTILSFLDIPHLKMSESYRHIFVGSLLLETAASMFAFWRQVSQAFSTPPNVNGDDWEYECIRHGNDYKHGGTCSLYVTRGPMGWEFDIRGERKWSAQLVGGDWQRTDYADSYHWENSWGTFTSHDALRYGYSVVLREHTVQGYGSAQIRKNKEGRVILMEGSFYQLPPHDPFYGFQRYKRAE